MKTITYLSILLITAGALLGLVDYAKASKNGMLKKVYEEKEVPVLLKTENAKAVIIATVKPELKSSAESIIAKKNIVPKSRQKKTTKQVHNKSKNKNNLIAHQKKTENKITSKTKISASSQSRKFNIRDYGRGSLRQKK